MPHGAPLANAGVRRDPLIAARVVAWLQERYARRRAGDREALRPFLLVASFVNPHDIVLFPAWARRSPLQGSPLERYRDLYDRLHAEVDSPIDLVRRTVTDGGSDNAVLVRTADHGGLHQKWFNLHDEAARVPFVIARVGPRATTARQVTAPTSHIDLVPTLLGAAGVDVPAVATTLTGSFTEVHELPGRDLMPVVDGAPADETRAVYLMTRDNVLEGDTGASGVARELRQTIKPPAPLRIRVPAHVGSKFEGLVLWLHQAGGQGHLWKLVRTFDDPSTWTEPGVRHLAANGIGGEAYRTEPLDDQWELYDLTADPIDAVNRWTDPDLDELRRNLRMQLKQSRAGAVPERNKPWPYVARRAADGGPGLVRRVVGRVRH